MQYNELNIRLDRNEDGTYQALAWGATGEAAGTFKPPFSELEVENFVLSVGRTRRGKRRLDSPEMQRARDFGGRLFDALFQAQVRDLYRDCYASARTDGKGLRLKLSLGRTPELTDLPWEYLYDSPAFLSISQFTPVVRYLDLPRARPPLAIEPPLRILAMISAPTDAVTLDVEDERRKVEQALSERLIRRDLVEVTWLEQASLRALQRELRRRPYHVFHFIGHGGYDPALGESVLLLEDESERARLVSGTQLGTILADHTSLRLAVLNACEGARTSRDDPFSGVAAALVQHELPAVIAMQFEITDRAAIIFAEELYAALVEGLPVDAALAETRKAIYGDSNDVEWGTPVLFMRVHDGRVFDLPKPSPERVDVEHQPPESAAEPFGGASSVSGPPPVPVPAEAAPELRPVPVVAEAAPEQRAEPTPTPVEAVREPLTEPARVQAAESRVTTAPPQPRRDHNMLRSLLARAAARRDLVALSGAALLVLGYFREAGGDPAWDVARGFDFIWLLWSPLEAFGAALLVACAVFAGRRGLLTRDAADGLMFAVGVIVFAALVAFVASSYELGGMVVLTAIGAAAITTAAALGLSARHTREVEKPRGWTKGLAAAGIVLALSPLFVNMTSFSSSSMIELAHGSWFIYFELLVAGATAVTAAVLLLGSTRARVPAAGALFGAGILFALHLVGLMVLLAKYQGTTELRLGGPGGVLGGLLLLSAAVGVLRREQPNSVRGAPATTGVPAA